MKGLKIGPVCLLPARNASRQQRYTMTKSERKEKDTACQQKAKWTGISILIANKIGFNAKSVKTDKVGYYVMVKGAIQQAICDYGKCTWAWKQDLWFFKRNVNGSKGRQTKIQ